MCSIASIHPFRVYIDGLSKIYRLSATNPPRQRQSLRTVDLALISLIADFAAEVCNTVFLVHADCHGIVVVAKETGKGGVCTPL